MAMVVKDRIVSWFVQNIVLPKVERIDKPGFITITTTTGKETTNIRELFMPEQLLVDLENEISRTSKSGDLLLYVLRPSMMSQTIERTMCCSSMTMGIN